MQVIKTIREMQKWSMDRKKAGKTVAVVPTMGFLHEGHLSLIDAARANGADAVVVTIFVNPIQFAPNEDFDSYPRDFEHDAALLREKNVDAVFAPAVSEMYPAPVTCMVIENKLSKGLCAKTRPTHFNGVTTVVAKLFNATLPDIAVFGQKDAQQARVLKRMVRDLNFPIRMVVAPIVREADGLAKSSRNKYLSEDERARALVLASRRKGNGGKGGEGPGEAYGFHQKRDRSPGRESRLCRSHRLRGAGTGYSQRRQTRHDRPCRLLRNDTAH